MAFSRRCLLGLSAAALLAATASTSNSQAATVKDVFETYGLIGTFSTDCSQPPSERNVYVVFRGLDGGYVQRDYMIGPTERFEANTVDSASASAPDRITFSYLRKSGRLTQFVHVDGKRIRLIESTPETGDKLAVGGRFVRTGRDTPWFNKCD